LPCTEKLIARKVINIEGKCIRVSYISKFIPHAENGGFYELQYSSLEKNN